jgi:hypothetical protein
MDELKGIRSALVSEGYESIPSALTGKNDRWYRRQYGVADIENILFLEYKPAAKSYSVHAGVVSVVVREMLINELPLIRSFLATAFCENIPFLMRPCWTFFDACKNGVTH